MERNKDKRALAKYRHMELTLDDEQNDELVDIMAKVETVGKDTLEEIFTEAKTSASACGAANTLRRIWEDDKRNTKDIILDQQRNSMCAYSYCIDMMCFKSTLNLHCLCRNR